jgi:hypothetical protein
MKRKQHSTTTENVQIQKILGSRATAKSPCCGHFRAIETLWRILFQTEQDRLQR